MTKLTVLVTGPGGRIGPHIVPAFRERYDLRLLDRKPLPGEPDAILADLSDKDVLKRAMAGVDVVLHLAAQADEAPFLEELVPNNVVGVYNTFQAAHEAGVRRVVFASTVQTIGFNKESPVPADAPPHPVSMYGCTKVFGETLGRWYHDKHGMEFIALRIGAFQDYDSDLLRKWDGFRDLWLSPRDAVNIFQAAIETPGIGYGLAFATSITAREVVSRAPLKELFGYEAQDDIRKMLPELFTGEAG